MITRGKQTPFTHAPRFPVHRQNPSLFHSLLSALGAAVPLPAAASHGDHDPGRKRHNQGLRSEEHTSELQSLMRISYAVFCSKKKIHTLITKQQRDTNKTQRKI